MKTSYTLPTTTFCLALLAAAPAAAADNIFPLQIQNALDSSVAHEKLDGSIRFFFGDAPHGAVLHAFGEYTSNQKTNSFLKSDETVCTRAFVSALIEMQKRAQELGANAVVDIHSYYKKEDVSSTTEIPCHVGGFIGGVALRGRFVQMADH